MPDIETEWKITENKLKKWNGISADANAWYKLFFYKLLVMGVITTIVTAIFVLNPFDKEAKVTEKADKDSLLLSGKKELSIPNDEPVKMSKRERNNISETYTSLTKYNSIVFDFSDMPLNKVAGSLEKEYGVSIILENPDAGNCRITSRFEHKTLTEILDIMGFTLGFKYKYLPEINRILILGNGCK
ncbi:DUF4974 domain-containing protein [Dyadobacter flavalbus]|uniref:DUF4974 domain-containing protein n=1 Tax=Dyadobacter flavalbus TaxID=2579942 RepID=A0A5M8QY85_9BACT|nr:DUF4974 domain-containing protein [Dyadobacter flavalbus]KAA6440361.1 DUF4974 domain-containing protein [Dyadobacter flavalbus]